MRLTPRPSFTGHHGKRFQKARRRRFSKGTLSKRSSVLTSNSVSSTSFIRLPRHRLPRHPRVDQPVGRLFQRLALEISLAAGALAKAQFPVHFLDFETFMPALPVFAGTRPYQSIPFQWSDHVLSIDERVSHREYLHDGPDDPRRRFAESLLDAVGVVGSVVVYSGYEKDCLRELETVFPEFASRLAPLRARLFDRHPVIKAHIYDPAFHGSFSIKSVIPALVPHLSYDDLEIGDGSSRPWRTRSCEIRAPRPTVPLRYAPVS